MREAEIMTKANLTCCASPRVFLSLALFLFLSVPSVMAEQVGGTRGTHAVPESCGDASARHPGKPQDDILDSPSFFSLTDKNRRKHTARLAIFR